jgi:hypothetical protein
MKVMGEDQNINVDSSAVLNAMYELQRFTFSLSSRGYHLQMNAIRKNERAFKVKLSTADTTQHLEVDIPSDVVLYSPMMELAMKQLKPGQHFTLKTLDPVSFSTALVTIRALRKDALLLGERKYDATVLSTEYRGTTVLSWMDADGNILRQDTPFGWALERCTPEQALTIIQKGAPAQDMLAAMAVPCGGSLKAPRQCRRLRMRLTGAPLSIADLEITDRQKVVSAEGGELVLEVSAATIPAEGLSLSLPSDEEKRYLMSTPALQAAHPDIVAKAREITAPKSTAWEKSRAIYEWVYRHVDKEMTISLPSALDVLHTLKGDCNEHTYLTVALARATGLPAKVTVGLAYHEGAFYYHAWPSLYAGKWIEMDPTWGQETVDATHIALVQGEMEQQIQLVKVMGQLRIQIVEEYDHD